LNQTGKHTAGVVIDVNAKTGSYNLQLAYSIGWLAGNSSIKNSN